MERDALDLNVKSIQVAGRRKIHHQQQVQVSDLKE